MKKESGLTLVELMITIAILSIGVLAMIGSYRYISTSIQYSKEKTLANNLVMEQIEKLKNLQYYSLLVTTTFSSDFRYTPSLDYDNTNYPAVTLVQGGITFTRLTRVDFATQFGTTISTVASSSNDTGLKLISVYVTWQDLSGLRYQELHSLTANPAANPLNASFSGTVLSTGGAAISGATVKTIDNPNYYGTTNAAGVYQFNVSSGNYTLSCSSRGYFSADRTSTVASGGSQNVPFTLSRMSYGTASGYAYINSHLVVSAVVVSTDTPLNVEYVELYNPTTAPVNIGTAWPARSVDFYIFDPSNDTHPTPGLNPVPLIYVSTYIASNKYYLIANTSTIHVAGLTRNADAYYTAAYQGTHLFTLNDAGGTGIADLTPHPIDSLAWDRTATPQCPSTPIEGTCIDFTAGGHGLGDGEILLRLPNPGVANWAYGRAYDSNSNNSDFFYQSFITAPPNTMSQGMATVITGTPADGAYVTSNDPLSSPVQCNSAGLFTLPNIATGTWTLALSSGTYFLEISTVQMTPSLSTTVPNGVTTPAWPAVNFNNALLNDTTSYAFISGVITDANNIPLSGILVNAGGVPANTNPSGRYFVSVATGDVLVIANYNNQDGGHASQSSTVLNTVAGQVYDNPLGSADSTWFQLPLTGTLIGYFQTSSLTALPGQTLVALSGGNQVAQAVSDNSGHAYLVSLPTGTYTLNPALDPVSTVSPTSTVVTLSSTGTVVSVSTFTVSSGLAQIGGHVRFTSGAAITTGVTILASSATLSGTNPPTINGGLGTLCAPCYYGASSDSTGAYTVYVRSSTTAYQLYGWYTSFSGSISSTTKKGPYSLTLSTAGASLTQDMTW